MQASGQSKVKLRQRAGRISIALAALLGLSCAASAAAHSASMTIQAKDLALQYCVPGDNPVGDLLCMRTALTGTRHVRNAASIGNSGINDLPTEPDWNGLQRDTAYFLGLQFVVVGILYTMPENVSSWSKEDKEKYSFGKWRKNVSGPVKDEDDHFINYVLHPYWGASYFVRARERSYSEGYAFGYSIVLSTLYEYGAEALFEPVSMQDLIVTPVAGSLLGKLLFETIRGHIKNKREPLGLGDRFLLAATDPLGAASRLADELLGQDAEAHLSVDIAAKGGQLSGDYLGLSVVLRW